VNRLAFRAALLASLALSGCASAPPTTVKEVAPDTFNIRYSSSRHGSKIAPEDRVMLLAAETTLEHKARYFALVGIGDETPSKTETPAKSTASAAPQSVYGIYGVGGTSPQPLTSQIATSKKGITIKCFVEAPRDLIVSDAVAVEKDIKKKYALP
jgi:hypothetical protein